MKFAISGQNHNLVLVPNRGGTGTTWVEAKWYRYQSKWYRYHSLEPGWYRTDPSGTGTNASNSLDICVLALLSPNSYTDSIGTLG